MDTAVQVTEAPLAPPPPAGARYTLTAQALHWVTTGLMFVVLPLAWVMVNMGRDNPDRTTLFTLHKSVGLTILALVAVRLLWRHRNPAPVLRHTAWWEAVAARVSHWLLYVIMIGMPVGGYLLSAGSGRPVSYFGLFSIPGMPKNETMDEIATWLHVATGQWAVYTLILLHLAATAWHVVVRRDGLLGRMLPAQSEGA
jgi:cytochrome b561